jgi:hypothetical protein
MKLTIGDRTVPLATDHLLHPTLSALSGSTVEVTGVKADGKTGYVERRLENVSYKRVSGDVFVIGFDPQANGVRQFPLTGISLMRVTYPITQEISSDELREINAAVSLH